ncbi:MAG: aminoacyl-tRNA hydrolase [Candidatus Omnitrophica bacterium]|nr:aminoacyl-tRNA hydrolase [Candidatus Omnitrophota bacterium]
MKLIVGLGNPGRQYRDSRHNIGFLVAKRLSKIYKIPLRNDAATSSLCGQGKIRDKEVLIALPFTFMNISGKAVRALFERYRISINDLLVVCDDLDLEFGRIRIKPKGSSGGHKGLKSIIESLGTQDFCRLRIGIGRNFQDSDIDITEYVLSPFNKEEKNKLKTIIDKAVECCSLWIIEGVSRCMNDFNRKDTRI